MSEKKKVAIIIGAGPAGLTAAHELLKETNIHPIILEESSFLGGISRTVNYKGNRMDIGGHRLFTKSDVVLDWWKERLPFQRKIDDPQCPSHSIISEGLSKNDSLCDCEVNPDEIDDIMLVRQRISRILHSGKFFDYPVTLSWKTIKNIGFFGMLKIGFGYLRTKIFPIKPEKTLEDFFINRFGRPLYKRFFKSYSEKLWGVPCKEIGAEWGAQRVKGVSGTKVVIHALLSIFSKFRKSKKVETSFAGRFFYPKYGPGQLWEKVARQVNEMGGRIILDHQVKKIEIEKNKIKKVVAENLSSKQKIEFECDYCLSTMAVKDLINSAKGATVPEEVKKVSEKLPYRDIIVIGILLKKFVYPENKKNVKDTWIYIQEKNLKMGRIEVFHNWSPYMVDNPENKWVVLEYFANEGDKLWIMSDEDFSKMAFKELLSTGMIDDGDVLDFHIERQKKAYPSYFGTYKHFDIVKNYMDSIKNLYPMGRNGLHRYNNQDHAMLTAIETVKLLKNNSQDKSTVWKINTEKNYQE